MDRDPQKTLELLNGAREGRQQDFTLLFERYRDRLVTVLRRKMDDRLRRRIDPEDIVQETFSDAFADLSAFAYRGEGSLYRWLLTIALRKLADGKRFHLGTLKRAARGERSLQSHVGDGRDGGIERGDLIAGKGPTPSVIVYQKERDEIAEEILAELPEDYRTAIRLSIEEGLPLAEVGARMGRSAEAARKLVTRAAMACEKIRKRRGLPPRASDG
jgi:RNA polymerase sigma-70 factor (ECF subfamily)